MIMNRLQIGNLIFPNGLVLAPMAGVTDRAFRQICREYGAELVVSEMISAKAIHYRDKKTYELAHLSPIEHPAAVQIFGSEPNIMAEAARFLTDNDTPPEIIDINMGCPVRKIVGNGEGSALMQDPHLAAEIVRSVKAATTLPVTVKCRTGIHEGAKNVVEFAKRLEDAGADAICVHGRTREQMYRFPVDRESIAAVKTALSIPVIANGGIKTAEDALSMYEDTGCDGIAIAQGAYGNPFLFLQIKNALQGIPLPDITLQHRLEVARYHLQLLLHYKGDSIGVREGRRQISWYFNGINGAAALRNSFFRAETSDDFQKIFSQIEEMILSDFQ